MATYTVHIDQVTALLQSLSGEYEILVPAALEGGFYDFVHWDVTVEIAWDYDLAYNSLKRYFLPPREILIEYDLDQAISRAVIESPRRLLFGVHPYDLKAINILDRLMELNPPDPHYLARRDAVVIFAMEPQAVAKTAFWACVGAAEVDSGYDLYWTRISPISFCVQVGSPKGEEMLKAIGPRAADPAERRVAGRISRRVRARCRKQGFEYPWEQIPALLEKSRNSAVWEECSRLCLACGSCVAVCPTCYCFDVKEEADDLLKTGIRYREWDGCMLQSFAAVAGGHNFRSTARERYRHRIFRKGKYIHDRIGELGCVGCGRCGMACTAGIADPLSVFHRLREKADNEK